ncbi:hypothetical protein D3C78_703480 [compost metagenome]
MPQHRDRYRVHYRLGEFDQRFSGRRVRPRSDDHHEWRHFAVQRDKHQAVLLHLYGHGFPQAATRTLFPGDEHQPACCLMDRTCTANGDSTRRKAFRVKTGPEKNLARLLLQNQQEPGTQTFVSGPSLQKRRFQQEPERWLLRRPHSGLPGPATCPPPGFQQGDSCRVRSEPVHGAFL